MTENLQDELCKLESKQSNGAKLGATLLWLTVKKGGQNASFW